MDPRKRQKPLEEIGNRQMKTFARGKGLESYLRSLHQHYKLLGRAVVMKAPEPVNITGKRGSKVFGIIGRAYWPDFFGYVCVPPHPVFVGGERPRNHPMPRGSSSAG